MDELRWFLLILGVLVVAAIYGYGRIQDWRHDGPPWKRRRRQEREPFADETLAGEDIDGALHELDDLIAEQRTELPGQRPGGSAPAPADEPPPREPAAEDVPPPVDSETRAGADAEPVAPPEPAMEPEPKQRLGPENDARRPSPEPDEPEAPEAAAADEKIVVLSVAAPDGALFAGEAVVRTLEDAGLRYGEHGIFHRQLETRKGPVALFSVANIVEPGWFDLDNLDDLETPGMAFFLQLPGPFDGLAAFEQMLQTARGVADSLGGQLLDGRRCDLTQQSVEHIREELLEYRRRAHLAARQAR
ncbi:MAG: cell division protein ZipA [Ectothiorhodospiraceae bacterium]